MLHPPHFLKVACGCGSAALGCSASPVSRFFSSSNSSKSLCINSVSGFNRKAIYIAHKPEASDMNVLALIKEHRFWWRVSGTILSAVAPSVRVPWAGFRIQGQVCAAQPIQMFGP